MSTHPLAEFYASAAPGPKPLGRRRAGGQFKVVAVADLMANHENRPSMSFDRRPFYKISLVRGRSRVEYADREVEIDGLGLWFATSRVPYRWQPHDANQTGYVCLFTDEFLLPVKGGIVLDELPVFGPSACPVLTVSEAEAAALAAIFEKMLLESGSGYAYSQELLRAYLLELIYYGQKLRPDLVPLPAPTAAGRLATQFAELLEQQFPLVAPRQRLALRTARDYADALAVHVNHLNRVLKEATGHTTTALLADRVAQEARQLLKQSSWTVAEIADSLGFTDTAHFCHFFKRQTGAAPGDFRATVAV
ncbi:helix-turn-helix domain-containing protein [Hymenobacter bucti]|uniref:Helix-turn-helix domain-containing protein n=1 Tax=Hymenobacter bucti TaxID=1844114 RepID=A0ABW4QW11_9BACT